jgi:two-component system, cell cycle sensor histidine kinase and response regulator CckA
MPQHAVSLLLRYGCALASVAVAIVIRRLLDPLLGTDFSFVTVFLAILATALYAGFLPALAALAVGALALDYFLVPPRGSFELVGLHQQLNMVFYILMGIGIAALAGSMHKAQQALRDSNEQLATNFGERTQQLATANQKLRATEELSRLTLQGIASHAVILLDAEGNVVTWNPGAERIEGYTAEEILGKHFSTFYTAEDIASGNPQRALQMTSEHGHFEEEGWRVRKDGSRLWATVTITPLYDHVPQPIGFVKISRDVSKRKELTGALEAANQFNRATLDGLSANIAILDENGVILAVNKPWEDFASANAFDSKTTLTGMNYLEVCDRSAGLYSDEGPVAAAGIRAVLAGEIPQFELVYPCHSPSEQRWFMLRVTRFPDTSRRLIIAHENITERMRTEEALLASEGRLRLFIESAPAALAMFDEQMRYLAVSRRWISDYGLESEEALIGRCHYDVFPDLPEAWKLVHRRAMAGEVVRGGEDHIVYATGQEQWLKWEVLPWSYSTGMIGGIVIFSEDTTGLKLIEAQEQNLQGVVELSRDFIAVANLQGQVTYMNSSGRRMIGLGEEDDPNLLSFTDYVPAAWHKYFLETVIPATRERGHWEGEMQLRHLQTGALIDVFRSTFLLHDAAGQAQGYATVTRDITEQKRVAEAVRVSEQQLRLMIEGVSDHAIFMLDPEGKILTWNRGAEEIYGSSAVDTVGRHYSCLFTPEDVAYGLPMQELSLAAAEGMAKIKGWRLRRNGSWFWANGTLAALYDENHKARGFAKVLRDSTTKRHNDELLQSVLDSTLDGIISIDEHGTIAMINSAGESLFGYAASEVIGQNVRMLMPEPYRREHDNYLKNYLRTGKAKIIGIGREVQGLRKDGSVFPVDLAVTKFRLDEQLNFVGIVRDISEKKKLESQFHQAQKMEAFGQLAGGVAHDFNNLLTVISGFSEMVLEKLSPGDDKRSMVQQISQAGERAASLTRQLLAFSRQQVLEPRVVDLDTIVLETGKMLGRLIGEDVKFETVLPPNLPSVKVDPGQIEQVIINLAVNARDAMLEGGKLSIETSEIELDASYVKKHPGARPGQYVLLAVSDTGTGMTPDVKARVFEPFFTTKGVGEGTGLGLAVVDGIVKQSGGIIDIYSEPGVGTTFKIFLPAILESSPSGLVQERAAAPGGSETILLVEDEAGVRDFAALVLQGYGYEVLTAEDGNAAVHVMETHMGKIDLLMTDVVMPGISGRQLAEKLQAHYPGLKVLFLSGYTDDSVVRHGVLQADVAFLQKPFTPNSLAQTVRNVLDHR